MSKKITMVAGFGTTEKKSIMTASGDQYFLPEGLREKAVEGLYAVVGIEQSRPYKRDASGNVLTDPATGKKLLDTEAKTNDFKRTYFIGSYTQCVKVKNEEKILAGAEEAITQALQEKMAAKLTVSDKELAEMLG